MNHETRPFSPVAEPRPEAPAGEQIDLPHRNLIASGGNRLSLPPEIRDLQFEIYRRNIEARSEKFYQKLAERIQLVRESMREEYGDDLVINDPPHVVPTWENRNQRQDPTGQAYFVEDPQGTYVPHSRDAIIRDQRYKIDDSAIMVTHWIEGNHFLRDNQGNFLLNAEGQRIPLGEFITGPDGPETVVTFQMYVRQDGHWQYYSDAEKQAVQIETPAITDLPETAGIVFGKEALIA